MLKYILEDKYQHAYLQIDSLTVSPLTLSRGWCYYSRSIPGQSIDHPVTFTTALVFVLFAFCFLPGRHYARCRLPRAGVSSPHHVLELP